MWFSIYETQNEYALSRFVQNTKVEYSKNKKHNNNGLKNL